jgi:hypothetical protein
VTGAYFEAPYQRRASEWIAQRCTFTQYLADTTCGGTRGALGNWSTHLSRLGT